MLGRNNITKLMTSIQQTKIALDLYSKSPRWVEISALIESIRRAVDGSDLNRPETAIAIRRFNENLRSVALAVGHVVLPTAEVLQTFTENAARESNRFTRLLR